jgi:hypothetical protein
LKAVQNNSQFVNLRKKFQTFEYQAYSYEINEGSLKATFTFKLSDEIVFQPSLTIQARKFFHYELLSKDVINSLVFHVGMIELISYWKAACPARVVIKPHKLTEEQVNFWKKLYFNGLGEFFYLNGIETSQDDFMQLESKGEPLSMFSTNTNNNTVMIPVGGGKDSAVSLELLKTGGDNIIPMAMNPREAVVRTIENAGFTIEDSIVVKRTLDKKLLELNDRGFLNGHTPFSALLAFVTSFTAIIAGVKHIALSNESSANESTVPGSNINHQYSKSFEFEQDFNNYFSNFITKDIHYFSFLRPLNELQIGALFSKFKQHHFSFRSCNVGSKTDSWCGNCPKCLFTRIILGPFIDSDKLKRIFGKELFEVESLKPVFEELTGAADIKPFECVGTPDEVNASVSYIVNHFQAKLPALLSEYSKSNKDVSLRLLLGEFNNEHFVPAKYLSILKNNLEKISFTG